ncbi:unnamed protein product [Camellia sinensis]
MAPKKEKAPPSSKPAKSGGGKQKKKKWSKGKQKEKVNNMVLFDKATYDKLLSEASKYKLVTPSILSDRLRINGSLARKAIKDLMARGSIRMVSAHASQQIYTRATNTQIVEFTQFYPQAGWVEHDPMEIRESVRICMSKAIDKATVDGYNVDGGLKAIELTNQRETMVVWSKSTAFHLYNAIVWMDVRTSSICRI